ncbi:MAG TPA: PAS domain-containing protein [Caldimonas sp.]|nr:PAS domain-containing protein [Caldimonas sp.]
MSRVSSAAEAGCMANPMPVDRFNAADAARRTWPQLLESLLDAVCLVEPEGLRIVAANAAAGELFGVEPCELIGRDMHAVASTPEDEVFWRDVAAGAAAGIVSESYVCRADGTPVPTLRRVSRVEPAPGTALYVVALRDRSTELRALRHLETSQAELQATLESISDGVLVTDLAGHIVNFNRRFAAIWRVPDEMLLLRADDEIAEWMLGQVSDPRAYSARLLDLETAEMMQSTDRIELRAGGCLERGSVPQCSRGRPVGRVFTFRVVR